MISVPCAAGPVNQERQSKNGRVEKEEEPDPKAWLITSTGQEGTCASGETYLLADQSAFVRQGTLRHWPESIGRKLAFTQRDLDVGFLAVAHDFKGDD